MKTLLIAPTVQWNRMRHVTQNLASQFAKNGWTVFYGEHGHRKSWLTREVEPNVFRIGSFTKFVKQHGPFTAKLWGEPQSLFRFRSFRRAAATHRIWLLWDSFRNWRQYESISQQHSTLKVASSDAIASDRPWIDLVVKNGVPSSWLDRVKAHPALQKFNDAPIVFCGNWGGNWVDRPLLEKLARDQNVILVGEGPVIPWANHVGFISHHELPSILQYCKAGVIPFNNSEPSLCASPIKAYEYLASGIPVISSGPKECEGMPLHCVEPGDHDSFLAHCRSPKQLCSRGFVRQHTWSQRFKMIEARL